MNAIKLLNYQKFFIVLGFLVSGLSFVVAFIFLDCSGLKTDYPADAFKDCNTPFCQTLNKATKIIKSDVSDFSKVARLSQSIFVGNVKATGYEVFSRNRPFVAPFVSLRHHLVQIGAIAKCSRPKLIQVLFPNGWIELVNMVLFFSLYYCILLKLMMIAFRKETFSKNDFGIVKFQIITIVVIYAIAALLEAISVVVRNKV